MGTPKPDDWIASRDDWCGKLVQKIVRDEYSRLNTRILDVGAGWGKYKELLPEYFMGAVEIHKPHVESGLLEKYERLYEADIKDFVYRSAFKRGGWNVVIMGDVLEHLEVMDAYDTLWEMTKGEREVIVVVPYLSHQGVEEDNHHEIHLQDDLTIEVMSERYPMLRLCDVEMRNYVPFKGLYRKQERPS